MEYIYPSSNPTSGKRASEVYYRISKVNDETTARKVYRELFIAIVEDCLIDGKCSYITECSEFREKCMALEISVWSMIQEWYGEFTYYECMDDLLQAAKFRAKQLSIIESRDLPKKNDIPWENALTLTFDVTDKEEKIVMDLLDKGKNLLNKFKNKVSKNPEKAPSTHHATATPKAPKAPSVPENSKASGVSETTKASGVSETTKASDVSETTKASDVPETTKATDVPEISKASDVPETSKASDVPEISKASDVPETSKAAGVPETPKADGVPETPKADGVPETSKASDVPETSKATDVPEASKTPDTPETPETPNDPKELDIINKIDIDLYTDILLQEVEAKAAKLIADAQADAASIRQAKIAEAANEANLILERAKTQASKDGKTRALQDYDRMKNAYLESFRSNVLGTSMNNYRDALNDQTDIFNAMFNHKQEVENRTGDLKNNYQTMLNENVDNMRSMLNDNVEKLRKMYDAAEKMILHEQSNLYHRELKDLACAYQDLSRFTILNPFFTNDLTFLEQVEGGKGLIRNLESARKTMVGTLNSLEKAIRPLGLIGFSPKEGDAYDNHLHKAMEDGDLEGRTIRRCIGNGVMLKKIDSTFPEEFLLPAEVQLNE